MSTKLKTQNLVLIKSLKHFIMTVIPAGDLEVSLAFLSRRCVGTQKTGDPSEVSWEAESRFWVCIGEALLFSCVTARGRQCCHCCSLLVEIRSVSQTKFMCCLFDWWIFSWTQIIAFTESKVRVITVYLFAAAHNVDIHVQLSWEFLPTHLLFIITSFWSPSLLGDYTPLTSNSPYYWVFVCSRWCHQLLPAEMCTMMDHAEALDVAVSLQFLDIMNY